MTAIYACSDRSRSTEWALLDGPDVVLVEELCVSPKQIISLVPDEENRLVFMIHRRDVNLGAIQAAARQLGFDPLGVGIIDLDSLADSAQAALALETTLARLNEYPGSAPEQFKLLPSERSTRRGLLSLGTPVYVGAPMIVEADCVASDGCRVCASHCPEEAYEWSAGRISYDINTCVACGICITACPTGAIVNPAVDPRSVEAEIRAAIAWSSEPTGIRYRCRDSVVAAESGWHVVEVPCTGMLTVGWLLAPLLLGASRVDAVDCDAGRCRLANGERLATTLEDFQLALANAFDPSAQSSAPVEQGWFGHDSTRRVLAHLNRDISGVSIGFESADVGFVSIDASTCTACEMCANICPTGALDSLVDGTGVHISFAPQSCIGCGQCVGACPELAQDAITMTRSFDGAEWALGRREIRHEPTPACEVCGRPVAPAAMLSRIEEMLGEDAENTMPLIRRRCLDCRGR